MSKVLLWVPGCFESSLLFTPNIGGKPVEIYPNIEQLLAVGVDVMRLRLGTDHIVAPWTHDLEPGPHLYPETLQGVKKALQSAGWKFRLWTYDWRLRPSTNAERLVAEVSSLDAEEVALCGYSLGGVIALLAWPSLQPGPGSFGPTVTTLVTIGSPLGGCWSAVKGLTAEVARGQIARWANSVAAGLVGGKWFEPTINRAALNIVKTIAATWPVLYAVMPDPQWLRGKASTLGAWLYRESSWAVRNSFVGQKMLDIGLAEHALIRAANDLPKPTNTLSVYSTSTYTLDGGREAEFTRGAPIWEEDGTDGDGIVTQDRAQLSPARLLKILVSHGALVTDPRLAAAIGALLGPGADQTLPPLPTPSPLKPPVGVNPGYTIPPPLGRLPVTDP